MSQQAFPIVVAAPAEKSSVKTPLLIGVVLGIAVGVGGYYVARNGFQIPALPWTPR